MVFISFVFVLPDDALPTSQVPFHAFFNCLKVVASVTLDDDGASFLVPFVGKKMVIRLLLTDYPVVNYLIIDCSLFAIGCGGA
jgi:hypothetical protein